MKRPTAILLPLGPKGHGGSSIRQSTAPPRMAIRGGTLLAERLYDNHV